MIRNHIIIIAALLLLLAGCASIGQKFSAGEPKNRLPLLAKDRAEEVQNIAVPPFSGDSHAWHEAALEVMAQSPKSALIPQKKLDSAIKAAKKEPAHLLPEERIEYTGRLGRSVQADAVLNGMILSRDDRYELILQLVASRDSRVLWFQAADFSFQGDQITKNDQKELLSRMLSSLMPVLGKKDRPVPQAQPKQELQQKTEPDQRSEQPQKPDQMPRSEKKAKPSKKPEKDVRPPQAAEDVSPM
ncbi:MAG: hypothetical protein HZB62_02235 [Nitrospirae bacterium]|nr:hypothetical protein [Nitrospirota bacterium]